MLRQDSNSILDTILIYHSAEDSCWIAQGLHTDQIGTGDSVLEALTDAIRAVDEVCQVAKDDPTVAYLREAPAEIQEMAKVAPLLPREIYEIAYRRARGQWPEELPVEIRPGNDQKFVTVIEEEVG